MSFLKFLESYAVVHNCGITGIELILGYVHLATSVIISLETIVLLSNAVVTRCCSCQYSITFFVVSDQALSVSGLSTPAEVVPVEATPEVTPEVRRNKTRRGKAPPVDSYTGEDPGMIGCQYLRGQPSGTSGHKRSSCYSWRVTCVGRYC